MDFINSLLGMLGLGGKKADPRQQAIAGYSGGGGNQADQDAAALYRGGKVNYGPTEQNADGTMQRSLTGDVGPAAKNAYFRRLQGINYTPEMQANKTFPVFSGWNN